jgi:hypothetical protein
VLSTYIEARTFSRERDRLSAGRVRELFGDPDFTGRAAANPRLPVSVMRSILDDGGRELANEQPPEGMAIALGAWAPGTLPFKG